MTKEPSTSIEILIGEKYPAASFDQQMANKIGDYMEEHGVNMVRECVPESIERIEEVRRNWKIWCFSNCTSTPQGAPGKLKVTAKYKDGTTYSDEFNTVIFAIGRDACTQNIGLDKVNTLAFQSFIYNSFRLELL